jgi:Uma2 family endonuclease
MSTIIEPTVPPTGFTPGANGRIYAPDDLLQMPDEGRYELVDGKLVERNIGAESSLVGLLLMTRVTNYVSANALGFTFTTDCGYQIYPQRPNLVRYPDGSFLRFGRLPNNVVPQGHMRIVPDLVLEVVSSNDRAIEVQEKIEEYHSVNVPLLWLIYPNLRSIYVYRTGHPVERLGLTDTLTGGNVLPGFSCPVADLFPSPPIESLPQSQS